MTARPTVLVLWTGFPAGARAVRALRGAGFRVVGAHPLGRSGGRSLACPRPLRYPAPSTDPEGFMAVVAAICVRQRVDVVVPIDEEIVRLLADRGDELPAVVVGPDAAQYATLCDKVQLTETARRLGLDVPETVLVTGEGRSGPWPALPSIVKPQTSRSESAKPRAVHSAAERDEYVSQLLADGNQAVVQELVSGTRWVVQSVRGPETFEYVALRVRLEWPRGAGLASLKSTGEKPPAGLITAARALLDHAGYVGPSGVSFIERDGRFHPHDANLRLGATSGASQHAGFAFQRRAVEVTLGVRVASRPVRPRRGSYMRLDLEVEAFLAALRGRRDGGDPWGVLRGIAAVALSPRGKLDPSPFEPFWAASLLANPVRRMLRRRRLAHITSPVPGSGERQVS